MASRRRGVTPRIPRKIVKNGIQLKPKNGSIIFAPVRVEHFRTGFDNRNQAFLKDIENALLQYDEITLSFKYTEEIKATATLVIYSIIDTFGKDKKINVVLSSRSVIVNENIESAGSFQPVKVRLNMLDNSMLPVIQGNNAVVNKLSRQIINTVVKLHLDKDSDDFEDRKSEIGTAILETLDNVGRHAYPEKDHDEKLWWFCCDIIEDTLFMAIYDNGVGIPHSIKTSKINFFKLIDSVEQVNSEQKLRESTTVTGLLADIGGTLADEVLIQAAMSEQLSKTTKNKHGKGSGSMKALIKEEKQSFMLIGSGKGLYCYSKYNKEKEDQDDEQTIPLDNAIKGTLIQWSL